MLMKDEVPQARYTSIRDLGVIVDEKFTFSDHIVGVRITNMVSNL